MFTLTTELSQLHESYIAAVNEAVALEDEVRIEQLTHEFDRDALELMSGWLQQRPAA